MINIIHVWLRILLKNMPTVYIKEYHYISDFLYRILPIYYLETLYVGSIGNIKKWKYLGFLL